MLESPKPRLVRPEYILPLFEYEFAQKKDKKEIEKPSQAQLTKWKGCYKCLSMQYPFLIETSNQWNIDIIKKKNTHTHEEINGILTLIFFLYEVDDALHIYSSFWV